MGIGRPSTTYDTASKLHGKLLGKYGGGARLARSDFNALVIRTLKVSISQAEYILKTGEGAGFWNRDLRPGHAGHVVLVALAPTPQATPGAVPLASSTTPA